MTEQLIEAQDIILGKVNDICGKFGLNSIMAQLYVILYLNNRPLSLNDMVERLEISKGSVSVNIRALERYGAVKRVWVKGSRQDFYEADMDVTKVILNRIKSMSERRLAEVSGVIDSSYQALSLTTAKDKEEADEIKEFRQRLDKMKSLYSQGQSMFNLFNSTLVSKLAGLK